MITHRKNTYYLNKKKKYLHHTRCSSIVDTIYALLNSIFLM